MPIKIALAGNPNSGKTTMFNDLTGSNQYVGNWPGVTVEKKEGRLKGHKDVILTDLPGIYSLSPYTPEEIVSRNYLINEEPNAIINIVDGTNIERNLYLTTQLTEMGIPVVIALNMIDIVRKKGDSIDIKKLSEKLGCEIIETSALKGTGSNEAVSKAIALAKQKTKTIAQHKFSELVEDSLSKIASYIENTISPNLLRWYSIKLFERDQKVWEQLALDEKIRSKIDSIIAECEKQLDDDSESIITNERYNYIADVIKDCYVRKNTSRLTVSDKIDRVLTNRLLAFPIFAAIIFLVYFISVTTVGGWATDWVNDVLFGEIIPPAVEGFLESVNCADWLSSLILDGIIGGVGAVLGFLPQMMVLFLCLSILEDCGYMARIAFIMDRIFRKFGLSGKSFIPIIIGTGCGVPGIMASRTIESEEDRKMTIMTTTFIPCSAKLPIISLIAGAFFPGSLWVAPSAYFIGIVAIICSGIILKKTKALSSSPAPFVMELPAYHIPGIKNVAFQIWDKSKSFVKKAGTIIFLASGLVWFLSNFNWQMQMVDAPDSILASLGSIIAPIFAPLGWGTWEAAVATLTGLVAKENVVGTFGVLYGFQEVAEDGVEIWSTLQASFTMLSAYSLLVFNLLCAPCFAAIGAIRREMKSPKWTFIALGYQTVLAYAVSLCIYQLGMLFKGNGFNVFTAIAIVVIIGFIYLLLRRPNNKDRKNSSAKKVGKAVLGGAKL
ncbi:ferrous iron transport protein B [Acetivibrio mesophilus]|uniref:Ferrous iron transport protein B n=1 Tax=Acetivibrio mesophilus TaxID=2487273 RepID=A0A4Q0IAQ9_9FIRM|nr:ferrous iron transport protein B [Acetivibrio mesophilus]RXE60152.1 ferrous iron transport protein B [Acetivibrio mesophilus]HHV29090.1 ferrous iron transport protein B [Clostridium sp.]